MTAITPIFIFSLPRSGSTLLQRLLLASDQCATLGEPSLLLRLLDNPPHTKRLAPYWESLVLKAESDMRDAWVNYDRTYKQGVQNLALSIYSGLSDNKPYFIDKTPRYSLIAEQIIETFPDAKFIILWRHPGAIADSLARAYRKGQWALREFEIDLFSGLDCLHTAAQRYSDRIYSMKYEDLTAAPAEELERLGGYLGIPDLSRVAELELPPSAGGQLGDQVLQVLSELLESQQGTIQN